MSESTGRITRNRTEKIAFYTAILTFMTTVTERLFNIFWNPRYESSNHSMVSEGLPEEGSDGDLVEYYPPSAGERVIEEGADEEAYTEVSIEAYPEAPFPYEGVFSWALMGFSLILIGYLVMRVRIRINRNRGKTSRELT